MEDLNSKLERLPKVNQITRRAYTSVLMALATMLFTVVSYKRNEMLEAEKSHDEQLKDIRRTEFKRSLAKSAIAAATATYMMLTYTPTATETTLAALLKYLKLKNVIDDSFVERIKAFKPHNVHKLGL